MKIIKIVFNWNYIQIFLFFSQIKSMLMLENLLLILSVFILNIIHILNILQIYIKKERMANMLEQLFF